MMSKRSPLFYRNNCTGQTKTVDCFTFTRVNDLSTTSADLLQLLHCCHYFEQALSFKLFNVLSVADYIANRKCKFLTGYINSQNSLCNLLCRTAKKDLSDITLR